MDRAHKTGARVTDIRVKLERPTGPIAAVARPFKHREVEQLAAISRAAFRGITRFYADPMFPNERCDDLYEQWLLSSCNGWAAQVLVVESADSPVGFVTIHVEDNVASIGLIAVDGDLRGCGAGNDLTNAAINWAWKEGVPRMTVVTQGRNLAAQRVFQRCGFITSDISVWMHKWYDGS
jgi:dTDP-4-amino-4,6-dideoxy-D-galactose acyltransferase